MLTTGQARPGDPAPDWGSLVRPGTTLALYMGVATAPEIRAALIEGGASPDSEAQIVTDAGSVQARSWTCRLADLDRTLRDHAIANPAMILLRFPKVADVAAAARRA